MVRISIRAQWLALFALALAGCGSDDSAAPDGGPSDSSIPPGDSSGGSHPDAGGASDGSSAGEAGDASVPPTDGGDAGSPQDGGDSGATDSGADSGTALTSLKHLVVLYMENHSYDNLFGSYPGTEGLSSPGAKILQIGPDGGPYATLPQTDSRVPSNLPNAPFDLSLYFDAGQQDDDPVHRFFQEQWQINGGKMDSFVEFSNVLGYAMGYWPTSITPLATFAQSVPSQVTVCDHFFHAAFGGSFLNHFWLIAAQTPVFPDAGAALTVQLSADGGVVADNQVTPDGYAINTLYSVNTPHCSDGPAVVPNQTFATIGDELSGAGIDWAWYSGGWYQALGVDGGAPSPDPTFACHHQPFAYFANYADGTPGRAAHLEDETDFVAAAAAGTLPPVSFVKPIDRYAEHPREGDIFTAENHAVDLINAVRNGPQWKDTVIIVTYDENGGQWDHVAPPATAPLADRWGPGSRVPTMLISPFAKGGVDSTVYDTTAILKLIEKRWGLAALSTRDAAQADLSSHALRFTP